MQINFVSQCGLCDNIIDQVQLEDPCNKSSVKYSHNNSNFHLCNLSDLSIGRWVYGDKIF